MGRKSRPQAFSNLYKFIRIVMGENIPDRIIAIKWRMDNKNFYDFKIGRYPTPRVERLILLAKVLEVPEQLVFEVASGTPAQKVYDFIQNRPLFNKWKIINKHFKKVNQPKVKFRK